MCITKWVNNLKKNMEWYDFSLIKGSVFFSTLFLLTVWEGFRNVALSVGWHWYLIAAIAISIPVCKKMMGK